MTQQPYGYPPQAPQQYAPQPTAPAPTYAQVPPQQYAPPAPAPTYAQPGYPPQQAYGQPAPQQPAPAPLADGSLDAFYSQPNTGGGPGVSWKGKPDGYTVQGVVPRDVTNADVTQEVGAPNTQEAGRPQFYRDGRPKFVMAVPLQLQASQEYPEGEARLFVRGQLRDELSRAMGEARAEGAPKAGDVLTVTLVQRKQGRGSIPQNIFAITYTPAGQQAPAVQQPQLQQYAQQPPPQQYAQAPQPVQQQPQYAPQQAQGAGAPSPAPAPQAAPVQQQQVPQHPQAPQPHLQQTGQLQVPPDFNPGQAELLAKLTGQQQVGA